MSIPFTQFLRPDGRQRPASIDRPTGIETMARQLIMLGWAFEIEELVTGQVSMEIVSGEDVIASRLCPNGPAVPKAVDEMAEEAYKTMLAIASVEKVRTK